MNVVLMVLSTARDYEMCSSNNSLTLLNWEESMFQSLSLYIHIYINLEGEDIPFSD